MRQIKFRGKRTDNGKWAYGYYLQNLTKGEIRHYIFDCPSMMEILPETVGQFTGLYDATKWEDFRSSGYTISN
jgi:hypothetical protein